MTKAEKLLRDIATLKDLLKLSGTTWLRIH